ncbi:hypothetical protein NEUTE1DRAFT_138309 [Neurospora tetrasperma FGSC 2508]|uniref:Uncharacterized protein n=1 Tax=Neurospora tetrasperma (strain FGSC 2508 / ATCC MYA-4615 / P0657) TaxID=510951 RepID=F8MND1_NEUT8|nr:uncharacterized protein NEUTE1DRAFT_138309 [Neurospora tetrasperma FGSC 2508]EGO56106.1 hypothetical protein NEUTE1DRAFT_138309 [Neurospora tetrasperma FGSC 2508]EGZ71042.1 hypothetical protein NEUTE2DRAFT_131042 [Neurospora tetrasperma FGSC 2509]
MRSLLAAYLPVSVPAATPAARYVSGGPLFAQVLTSPPRPAVVHASRPADVPPRPAALPAPDGPKQASLTQFGVHGGYPCPIHGTLSCP